MERTVSIYSGGHRIAGIIEVPDNHTTGIKLPGIVLCQGPGGIKELFVPDVAKRLTQAGFISLRFDYRGWGASEGIPNRIIPLEQVDDIRNAITFLQLQPEIDTNRLGLWGAATGGANATYVTGIDNRVKCMVSVSGMGNLGRWFKSLRRYWEWIEFLEMLEKDRANRVLTGKSKLVPTSDIIKRDPVTERFAEEALKRYPEMKGRQTMITLESAEAMMEFCPEDVVSRITPRSAMWICAGKDTLLPNFESQSMYSRAGEPRKLVVIEGEEHHAIYTGSGFEKMITATISWFKQHL